MAVVEWMQIDLRTDPHEAEHLGDPQELLLAAAFVASMLRRPDFHARAACAGKGTALFYPSRGEPLEPARAVCRGCPVSDACLAATLEVPACGDAGVWGGLSPRQRRRLRRTVDTAA